MLWLFLILTAVVGCFGFVLLRGAPYLPTLSPQVRTALELSGLQQGQTLLELGCGDGKVLIAAAEQGIQAVGYELNPLLWIVAWLRTRRYHGLVQVYCRDFWNVEWPPSEAIFVFLHTRFMHKLDTKIVQYSRKTGKRVKLISFAFPVPGRHAVVEQDGLFVYDYEEDKLPLAQKG